MAERITGHTELIGLMAYPIRHSSSPAMQNEAFAKLLDSVFQDTAWDVSSDISVLHTLLAQEGLTDDDFAKMKKN